MPRPRAVVNRQFASLGIYNYRIFYIGQLISQPGTWMQTTAQAWLVLQMTGSPAALGLVTTLQFLPVMFLTLIGGAVADRLPKRRVLVVTQAAALAQALSLAILVSTGTVELWHVYLLALWLGVVNAFDMPVRQSFAAEMVGRDNLTNAVALNSTLVNFAKIAGPGFAGVIIGIWGVSTVFYFNAFSYIAIIAGYAIMRSSELRPIKRGDPARAGVFGQVAEGVRYVTRTPDVAFLLLLLGAVGTFAFNFTVIVPLIAEFILHADPGRFGLLTACLGAGSLVAALGVAALTRPPARLLVAAAFGFPVMFVAMSLSANYWATAALLVVLGMVSLIFTATTNTLIQSTVPDHLRGRVMSIYFLLLAGTTPIGGYLTGFLAEHGGVPRTLVIEAGLTVVGVLIALGYRRLVSRPVELVAQGTQPVAH